MVVYERPPRTTPPAGKLEKANPAVVVIQHKDYNRDHFRDDSSRAPMRYPTNEQGPVNIPIEDYLIQKAKENAEHRVASSKDEVLPASRDPSQTTLVHIAPDSGAPGGAVSIVNQVPKETLTDASASRLVSLVPDAVSAPKTANYNQQGYGQSRSNLMQQYAVARSSNPVSSSAYPGYGYYSYPNFGIAQNAQARSSLAKANWPSVYNQLLQRKQGYGR